MSTLDHLADLAPGCVRPLRRAEFERLVEAGHFDDERIELLGGALVEMTPQSPSHAGTLDELSNLLWQLAGQLARVRVQLPFAASDTSLPEPDVALVPLGDYRTSHPTSAHLVVEVADSSRREDRHLKAEIYASANVSEYWVVDLVDRCVVVHTLPKDGAYGAIASFGPEARIRLVALDGVEIFVGAFLK